MIAELRADTEVDTLTAYAVLELVEGFAAGYVDDFNRTEFGVAVKKPSTPIVIIARMIRLVSGAFEGVKDWLIQMNFIR